MILKEEYPLTGCLDMEVDSQKRSDYLITVATIMNGLLGQPDRLKTR